MTSVLPPHLIPKKIPFLHSMLHPEIQKRFCCWQFVVVHPLAANMTSNGCFRALSNGRQHLLNAARGLLIHRDDRSISPRRILRCFPITQKTVDTPALTTPDEFHTTLCRLITSAKRRVYLASLYIGPAANPTSSPKELELLTAIQSTSAPQVKILLDKNRGLRSVPITNDDPNQNNSLTERTISSAEACFRAIQEKVPQRNEHTLQADHGSSGVYLFTVLPQWQQFILPNPYNEVAGVFHLKCYIIDDDIIFTGANLSEEYFSDRIDRYLWLTEGNQPPTSTTNADQASSLIAFYIHLLDNLCQHADPYTPHNTEKSFYYSKRTSKMELMHRLIDLFTVEESTSINESRTNGDGHDPSSATTEDENVVAYVVPTFQSPNSCFPGLHQMIPSDATVVSNLVDAISDLAKENTHSFQLRLASAYLNLTDRMIEALGNCYKLRIYLLTAGYISHGFKPNPKKIGNKGKSWIPAVFDALGRQSVDAVRQKQLDAFGMWSDQLTSMWYFQREAWTFHAKGIWFTSCVRNSMNATHDLAQKPLELDDVSTLCAAIHGSGNHGERSAGCDIESNLIFVFTDLSDGQASKLQRNFQADWNSICQYARSSEGEKIQPLSFRLRTLLPWIRSFF